MTAERVEVNHGSWGVGNGEWGMGNCGLLDCRAYFSPIKQPPIKYAKQDEIIRQTQIVSHRRFSFPIPHSPLPTPRSSIRNHYPVHHYASRLVAAVDAAVDRSRARNEFASAHTGGREDI